MSVSSVFTSVAPMSLSASASGVESGDKASPLGGFHRLIDDFLTRMHEDQVKVDDAVKDLALGRASDLHTVALATAKADIHFRMAMEIRTKLIDAFQEVMRMQV